MVMRLPISRTGCASQAFEHGAQTAILRRVDGPQAAGTGDGGRVIINQAPVSTGREARVTAAGDTRLFAGWRSDPFFCDVEGAKNKLQFTGADFFADKDVGSIVLEVPNSALGGKEVRLWGANAYARRWRQLDPGRARSAACAGGHTCRRKRRLPRRCASRRSAFPCRLRARPGAHRWIYAD